MWATFGASDHAIEPAGPNFALVALHASAFTLMF
jgi:hypothetical protein